jgi:hypothetical protein
MKQWVTGVNRTFLAAIRTPQAFWGNYQAFDGR